MYTFGVCWIRTYEHLSIRETLAERFTTVLERRGNGFELAFAPTPENLDCEFGAFRLLRSPLSQETCVSNTIFVRSSNRVF